MKFRHYLVTKLRAFLTLEAVGRVRTHLRDRVKSTALVTKRAPNIDQPSGMSRNMIIWKINANKTLKYEMIITFNN